MSLLIDALKQAEASRKQAEQFEPGNTSDPLSLESLEPRQELQASASAPNVENTAQASRNKSSTPERAARVSTAKRQEAIRDYFEVKQAPQSRGAFIIAAFGLIALLTGGAYLWWATQPRGLQARPAFAAQANSAQQTIGSSDISADAPPSSLSAPSPSSLHPSSPGSATPSSASAESQTPAEKQPAIVPQSTEAPSGRDTAKVVVTEARSPVRESGPSFARSSSSPVREQIPLVQAAYEAYLANDFALARARYGEVLSRDPRNIHALNALGMMALNDRRFDEAERLFRDALSVDPKDATAVSQLALLYAEGDPVSAETRLRSLIAGQPDATAPHFALGSLLARQTRWQEAQQAFFEAYKRDAGNPDVLFNLAVALDQLGQIQLAPRYYESALQALQRRPATFDAGAVRKRLDTLQNAHPAAR